MNPSGQSHSIPIVLIPLYGTEELAQKIEYYLCETYNKEECHVVSSQIVRFSTGDAKAVLEDTVRGADVYILMDVGNYSCAYQMYGQKVPMSPDEHFQNLKRTVSAVGGKAYRVNVISPLLYSSRQDRRISRESLDCAMALRELENIGVKNITAFDVHDNRVANAVPYSGFDDLFPIYQVIKAIKKNYSDVDFSEEHSIFISPDLGATTRNYKYTNELGLDMGIFYKRRSRTRVVGGNYVVEIHKYIGPSVKNKDVFIVDDMICSGTTMLDVAKYCKKQGAKRVFAVATFALFTEGIRLFNEAYENKTLEAVFITNASYRRDEIRNAPWYREVDITKYIAIYIHSVNAGKSISKLLDPHEKIRRLLDKDRHEGQHTEQQKTEQ